MTEVSNLLTFVNGMALMAGSAGQFQCLKGEFMRDFEMEKLRTNLKKR